MRSVDDRLLAGEAVVAAPALIDLEFANVLRGLVAKRLLGVPAAEQTLDAFKEAPIRRYSHLELPPRVWRLRQNLTAHDAACIALAELLGTDLLTLDSRIAHVRGLRCQVVLAE